MRPEPLILTADDFGRSPEVNAAIALWAKAGALTQASLMVNESAAPAAVGSTTALTGTFSTQMGIINFAPSAPLLPDTIYEVILPVGGVRDVVGNTLREEFRMRFSTGDNVDDTSLGVVSRYRFDETSGTTAVDSVSARHGTLTNFPAAPWGPGVIAGRLQFDGADDFLNATLG